MSAQDYAKEFIWLKNAIGMSNNKACYLFHKKLSFELKKFLAHHELSTEFDSMVKEVIKWSTKEVKALLDTGAMGNFISSSLAQQLGLQEGPSAWVTLANKSHTKVTRIEGNLGIKGALLVKFGFSIDSEFPLGKNRQGCINLDSMTLSTQKKGVTSFIPFNQTGQKGILTPEDTINVLATLKEMSQAQIPPELQDLAEAFSESSCSQLLSCRELDLCINLVPGSVPTWGKLYPVN
ncbi:hypothetical protein DSO57_1011340 [Entomophthora muscae]|uniref:Uncharacterized protein n=1 Tax=Entomophthora muscae TaxID=34485 RepID=A0ACC2U5C1_9FUNG|nr:hypothetical protein DSO57_1011340 [Entomophthora muscae]